MTIAAELLEATKLHGRIDHDAEDTDLLLMIEAAVADVMHAANYTAPATIAELPKDMQSAIIDQAAMLYDARGGATERDRPQGLSMAAVRVCARYRGVSLGAV